MNNNKDAIFEELYDLQKILDKKLNNILLTRKNLEFVTHCLNHYLLNKKRIKEKELHKLSMFLLKNYIPKEFYKKILNNYDCFMKSKVYSFNVYTIEYIVYNFDKFILEFSE